MEKNDIVKTLSKVFKKIGRDIKKILLLYSITAKYTGTTAVEKNYFVENTLYTDCENNLKYLFPELKSWDFRDLWSKVTSILKDKGIDYLWAMREIEQELIYEYYKEEIDEFILNRVNKLNIDSKLFLREFLRTCPESAYQLDSDPWQSEFWEMLDHSLDIRNNYKDLLVKLGLLYTSTWISAKNNYIGISYSFPNYLELIKVMLIEALQTIKHSHENHNNARRHDVIDL